MNESARIMGIYAHPADVATEAAGTMAIHADRGDALTCVVMSDGIRMHPHLLQGADDGRPVTAEQYREFRRNEVRRAAEIIGFRNVEFLGWDPEYFNATDERVLALARLIARYQPDAILTHYPAGAVLIDSNFFTGIYVTRAMHLAGSLIPRIDGVEPHFVRDLFFFLQDQSMPTRSKIDVPGPVADFYVDTTPVIQRVIQAFDQFVSQGYHGQAARKMAEAVYGRYGMHANTSYAEPFMLARSTTYTSLPLLDAVPTRHRLSNPYSNDLPGDQLIALTVPSATPAGAHQIPA